MGLQSSPQWFAVSIGTLSMQNIWLPQRHKSQSEESKGSKKWNPDDQTFAWDFQMDADLSPNRQKVNGPDRNQSPSDFCWPVAYNMNKDDNDTVCFIPQYLNQEDAVRLGPSDITDYGWPGTK